VNRLLRLFIVGALALSCGALGRGGDARADPDSHVSSTVTRGAIPYPEKPVIRQDLRSGDINLDFPAVDVRDLAKAVLGDLLGKTYTVAPGVSGSVTLVTERPIAKADVLIAFENALRASNLALIRQGGAYLIAPVGDARGQAPALGEGEVGFGSETIELRFIAAAELKAMLDPVVPGAITIADPTRNVITVTGATGQRQSIRDLIAQFDTDWLKGMSFGLYVPEHTDSRILAPEIDKLLNGEGSPSAGLVRLIVMDRINGILAVSAQPQYLDDVKRWLEVLDREGESSEPRLFVYRVQNGRSGDLAATLNAALGNLVGHASGAPAQKPTVDTFDVQPSTQVLPQPHVAAPAEGGRNDHQQRRNQQRCPCLRHAAPIRGGRGRAAPTRHCADAGADRRGHHRGGSQSQSAVRSAVLRTFRQQSDQPRAQPFEHRGDGHQSDHRRDHAGGHPAGPHLGRKLRKYSGAAERALGAHARQCALRAGDDGDQQSHRVA